MGIKEEICKEGSQCGRIRYLWGGGKRIK